MKISYTQKEVKEILNISVNTLQVWIKEGLIIPSISNPKGRGTTRLYSAADIVHIAIINLLSQYGYNRAVVKSFCENLNKKIDKNTVLEPILGKDENSLYWLRFGDDTWTYNASNIKTKPVHKVAVNEIVNNNKVVMLINLSMIMKEIAVKLQL